MESTMQQRRDEILAKKAKLAELKRQRELRKQDSASRQSLSGSPLAEVRLLCCTTPRPDTLTTHADTLAHTAPERRSRQADQRRQQPYQQPAGRQPARLYPARLPSRRRTPNTPYVHCQCRTAEQRQ
jgi:hypothetical protein